MSFTVLSSRFLFSVKLLYFMDWYQSTLAYADCAGWHGSITFAELFIPFFTEHVHILYTSNDRPWIQAEVKPAVIIINPNSSKNSLTHSHTITPFDGSGKGAFWKHCRKRRNCLYKQFLLFLQCFLLYQRHKLSFLSHLICRLQTISVWSRVQNFAVWEWVNTHRSFPWQRSVLGYSEFSSAII